MLYTSVLPPDAVELSRLPDIHHEFMVEGIIAVRRAQTFMNRLVAFFSAAWMGGATRAGCMRLAQARTKTPI